MRLIISTPTALIVDADRVGYVRAEDDSGVFGILPGHTAFLTVLAIAVLTWRTEDEVFHYAAVRGGVLRVRDGETVEVATWEAVTGDDLTVLEQSVLVRFRDEVRAENEARTGTARLQAAAVRRIYRYLRPEAARRRFASGPVPDGD